MNMDPIHWQTTQSAPPLEPDEVHVWRVFLDWPQAMLHQALSILSPEEKKRAERFVLDLHRSQFIVSHAALRHILSRYINQPAAVINFTQGTHGKPYLLQPDVQFNMSDSKQLALYAITKNREVGIDIEWMRPDIDRMGIAKRFFALQEQQQLRALPQAQQLTGFYQCWARKEAYIKVIGQGLSFPLANFSVSLQPDGFNNLLSVNDDTEEVKRWSLGSIAVAEGYAAALAVEGEISKIHYFDWMARAF